MAEQIRNLKCFLSYRRKDLIVVGSIHRIYQALEREFGEGHVFMDIDNLPPGANFREVLAQKVNRVCAGGGLGYFTLLTPVVLTLLSFRAESFAKATASTTDEFLF